MRLLAVQVVDYVASQRALSSLPMRHLAEATHIALDTKYLPQWREIVRTRIKQTFSIQSEANSLIKLYRHFSADGSITS